MKKLSVIYWSGSGNTEAMASAVADGAKVDGIEVELLNVSNSSIDTVNNSDYIALGCPAMGDEVLEEGEMQPFVDSIANAVKGKSVALFGSYGWGDGTWMRNWEEVMEQYGANLVDDGLIINDMPDDDGLEQCRQLGKSLITD